MTIFQSRMTVKAIQIVFQFSFKVHNSDTSNFVCQYKAHCKSVIAMRLFLKKQWQYFTK